MPSLGGAHARAATVVVVLGLPVSADATVVEALSFDEKVAAAPVIVHGYVERVASEWAVPDVRIRTMVSVSVKTSLKGDVDGGERILVERGGGTVDGVSQTAPGLSRYEVGEEVVLFLEPLGAHFVAIGIGIGKYEVHLDNAEPIVHHAPHVMGLRYASGTVLAPIPPMSPEPLDAFLERIRTLVARAATPRTAPEGLRAIRRRPPFVKPQLRGQ